MLAAKMGSLQGYRGYHSPDWSTYLPIYLTIYHQVLYFGTYQ
jgi:hypothetical protein